MEDQRASDSSSTSRDLFSRHQLPPIHHQSLPPIHHNHNHNLNHFQVPPNAHAHHPSLSPRPSPPAYSPHQWSQQSRTTSGSAARPQRPTLDSNLTHHSLSGSTVAPSTSTDNHYSVHTPTSNPTQDDHLPPTSDFVKKLFKMLEDATFQDVVSWGPEGDCFIVKDMNEFTKSILPKMFKHSNFASFVRQLNKYDFHKVKNSPGITGSEHAWTFKHPDFHAQRKDALENIKRKVPSQRKASAPSQPTPTTSTPQPQATSTENSVSRDEYDLLVDRIDELATKLQDSEQNHQNVLSELVGFQRTMAQQDRLLQNLIQYFLQFENAKLHSSPSASNPPAPAPSAHVSQLSLPTPPINTPHPSHPSQPPFPNSNFLPHSETARILNLSQAGGLSEEELAKASFEQMNEISRRAREAGLSFHIDRHSQNNSGSAGGRRDYQNEPHSPVKVEAPNSVPLPLIPTGDMNKEELASRRAALMQLNEDFQRCRTPERQQEQANPPLAQSFETYGTQRNGGHAGLQVFTVGHLMPRDMGDAYNPPTGHPQSAWQYEDATDQHRQNNGPRAASPQVGYHSSSGQDSGQSSSSSTPGAFDEPSGAGPSHTTGNEDKQLLRVRRSTFVPAWAVPPRVLLVEDDDVTRRLSSKFLQVFGCAIDVAVDGESAVNKMNLEKYDLVLMDIVMPKLDGVSATSLIRKFDSRTPIISVTSNSKPDDILYYYSQGMSDILPKPFTKEGLLSMLDKHLTHLKSMQAIRNSVPRGAGGMPPLNDDHFNQALVVGRQQQHHAIHPHSHMISQPHPSQQQHGYSPPSEDDEPDKSNPNLLAGMGLSDEHYTMILQNLAVGGGAMPMTNTTIPFVDFGLGLGPAMEKRRLEEFEDRDGSKRGRFEVIE